MCGRMFIRGGSVTWGKGRVNGFIRIRFWGLAWETGKGISSIFFKETLVVLEREK